MIEQVLGRIIESEEWDHPLIQENTLPDTPMDKKAKLLLQALQKHKPKSLEDLYYHTRDRKLIAYAMDLSNQDAEIKIDKINDLRRKASSISWRPSTEEEKFQMMVDNLPERERPFTNSAPFKRVYKAFYDFGNQRIEKEDYLNAYNDWNAYKKQQLGY